MSILTEITRIANARDDLKTALTAKGATVPSDVKIDDLAAILDELAVGNESITVTYEDKTTASVPVSTFILGMDWSGIETVAYNSASLTKLQLGNTVVWTSIDAVTVSVYGAASETVTITDGTNTYTVATTALGVGTRTLELPLGTYTVSGSVSGYSHSVEVHSDTTEIAAYPDGAVYWYGREIYPVTARLSVATTYSAATKNTNNIYISATHSGSANRHCYGQVITDATIDTSSYSAIKVIASRTVATGNGSKIVNAGYTTYNSTTTLMTGATVTATTATEHSTPSPGTSVYLGVSYFANTGGYTTRTTTSGYVYAIWME